MGGVARPGTFWGYRRADGTSGIRNHLLVVPSVVCANVVAQRVAALIPGAVAIPHPHGCAQVGDDVVLTERVLAGAAANPNVGAALIIGLGCETCQASQVAELASELAPGRPVASFYIQEAGGSIKAIARGVTLGKELLAGIAGQQREEIPLTELIVGTECGPLDASSVQASNPVVGLVADRVIEAGGTVLLSETPELVGTEEVLARRARDEQVARQVMEVLRRTAQGVGGTSPAEPPHSMAERLSCIEKAGTGRIEGVLDFGTRPSGAGLYLMDAPAHETVAVSAMAAGGAQLCLCTTGRGSPLGNAVAPVIRVCGNPTTVERMADNIDFSTVPLMAGADGPGGHQDGKAELGEALFRLLIDVCNGQLTNAEIIGHQEFAIHRIGPTV